jgi:citrate lyase subunit beta / citryl-CoA lyase
MRLRRSVLEVPGNVKKMVDKAVTLDADVIMLDLEDSVPRDDAAKQDARRLAGAFLGRGEHASREVAVRVNAPESPWFLDDMRWWASQPGGTLAVPKVRGWRDYIFVEELLAKLGRPDGVSVLLVVETPRCLLELERIAAEARLLSGLLVGAYDYTLECRASGLSALGGLGTDLSQDHLVYLRQKVVATAAAFGLDAIDSLVLLDPKDPVAVRAEAERAAAAGFTGCTVMYPPMAAVCDEVFSPKQADIDWAERVLAILAEASAGGRAAVSAGGTTLLPQHRTLAERILAQAEKVRT